MSRSPNVRRIPRPFEPRDLDRLAVPAIISGIAEPIISLVDTAFVGRLGTADLAAVGIASSFFLLVVWVLAQTRSAVLAVVARYYGERRLEAVAGLVPIAVWMNFLLGILFLALTNLFAEGIFKLYNAEGAVLEKAVMYFRVRSYGFPVVLATFAITGAFRGIQNLRWGMWISLLGALVNLILNPPLIFGFGSVEGLGIVGSAWASLIAQLVMFAVALIIMRRRTSFPLFPRTWRHPDLAGLWLLSGNLFARTIALNLCYYLGNRFATGYGEAYIGAHSIAMQIWLFSAFFIDGYAAAGSSLVGRFAGAHDRGSVYRVSWRVVRQSVLIGMALAGNCGYGALARIGGGDFRSGVVVVTMGIAAYATISGPLAPLRVALLPVTEAAAPASYAIAFETLTGLPALLFAGLVALVLLAIAIRGTDWAAFRGPAAWGALVGLTVAVTWVAMQWVNFRSFEAVTVTGHSFAAPLGETILYVMTSTGSGLSFGVGSVVGVVIGALLGSTRLGHFRWEACDDARELGRQLVGASMMGVGAVLAGGCSVGQGLSGFSVLGYTAPIALLSIYAGARIGLHVLIYGQGFRNAD